MARIPTRARLIEAFGAEQGSEAYEYLKGIKDPRTHPAVIQWAEQCEHDPRSSPLAYSECLMLALNGVLDGYDVEAIRGRYVDRYHQDIQAVYLNMGDTYAVTILLDHEAGRYLITSWGDWVERYGEKREVA